MTMPLHDAVNGMTDSKKSGATSETGVAACLRDRLWLRGALGPASGADSAAAARGALRREARRGVAAGEGATSAQTASTHRAQRLTGMAAPCQGWLVRQAPIVTRRASRTLLMAEDAALCVTHDQRQGLMTRP